MLRPQSSSRTVLGCVAETLAIAALYYGTGRLGMLMAFSPGIATPVWPPSGLALAVVVCRGYRAGLGLWLGSFLVESQVLAASGLPLGAMAAVAGIIALGSTIQAFIGACLIDRYRVVSDRGLFDRAQDVLRFVGIEALSCLVAATFGTTSVCLSGLAPWNTYGSHWWTWYLGDVVGIIIITPLLLTWKSWLLLCYTPRRLAEMVLVLVSLVVAVQVSFGRVWQVQLDPYMLIPILVWVAFRFGQCGTVASTLLVSAIAIRGTLLGFSPFVGETHSASLLALQAFMGIIAVTGLTLAAALMERTRAEEALRESEERFRQLAENIREVFWMSDYQKPAMLYISPAYEEIWGRTCQSLYEQPFSFVEAIHPADRQRVRAALANQQRGMRTRVEYRVVQPDGTIRWIWDRGFPIKNASGEVYRVTGIAEDITERKQVEAQLQFQAQLLDSVRESLVATDLDGVVTYWGKGAETLYGYRAEEILGQSITCLVGPAQAEDEDHRRRVARETGAWHGQAVHQRQDGSTFMAETTLALVTDPQSQPCGLIGLARDLTEQQQAEAERRRLEEQLWQANKMEALGTLAGGIAHEFNNLLSAILGFTELTQHAVPYGSRAWEHLHEVLTASHRAKEVVQQILAFSRRMESERRPLRPHAPVQEALRLLRVSLPATIELEQDCAEDIGTVLADAIQIEQIVMNLCVNAEQAMRASGGMLAVRLDAVEVDAAWASTHPALPPGPYVRLTVRDTGPGMTPAVRERIFDPFFTTKGIGEGTGMGLAVVHGIVTSHGGAVTVESTPGHGALFTVYLPRLDAAPACGVGHQTTLSQSAQSNARILVIDDEDTLARLTREMLTQLGYQARVFTSSRAALSAFRAAPQGFDLVLTDQTMPEMTGETFTHEVRQLRPDIPVILCTGFSYVMDATKAHALGIDAFLMKPVTLQDLANAIEQVIARRPARPA